MPSAREAERRRRRTAYVTEDENREVVGDRVDRWFTGTFRAAVHHGDGAGAEVEGLSLDAALAWARERADKVVVRLGDGEPRLVAPDEELPQPPRRRVAGEEWKDRTDADPDATWTVTVHLAPPAEDPVVHRPAWDAAVDAVARELGATWSGAELDGFLRDVRRADRGGHEYVMTPHPRAYVLRFDVRAPTHARAVAAAQARLPRLPDGWSAAVGADFACG